MPVRLEPLDLAQFPSTNNQNGHVITVAGNPSKAQLRDPNASVVAALTAVNNQPFFSGNQIRFFDFNLYATKKTISSTLLDVALLMANASQLKSVYLLKNSHPFYTAMVTLISISIIMQVVVGIFLIILSRININDPNEKKQKKAEAINTGIVLGVFVLTLVNVFISAIGISGASESLKPTNS